MNFVKNFDFVYQQMHNEGNGLSPDPLLWPEVPAVYGRWIRGPQQYKGYGCGIVGYGANKKQLQRAFALAGAVCAIVLFVPGWRQLCLTDKSGVLLQYVDHARSRMGIGAENVFREM
jgi:hypothetical protein